MQASRQPDRQPDRQMTDRRAGRQAGMQLNRQRDGRQRDDRLTGRPAGDRQMSDRQMTDKANCLPCTYACSYAECVCIDPPRLTLTFCIHWRHLWVAAYVHTVGNTHVLVYNDSQLCMSMNMWQSRFHCIFWSPCWIWSTVLLNFSCKTDMHLFEGGVYFAQSSWLCGYYSRVAIIRGPFLFEEIWYTSSNSPAGKGKAVSSSRSLGKETPGKIEVVVLVTRYVTIYL